MSKIIKLGNLYPSGGQAGWIYSPNGLCPTMVTMTGGMGKEPKVLVKINDKNKLVTRWISSSSELEK